MNSPSLPDIKVGDETNDYIYIRINFSLTPKSILVPISKRKQNNFLQNILLPFIPLV